MRNIYKYKLKLAYGNITIEHLFTCPLKIGQRVILSLGVKEGNCTTYSYKNRKSYKVLMELPILDNTIDKDIEVYNVMDK